MATDDLVQVKGTQVTLEANKAAIAAGGYSSCDDKDLLLTDDAGFPFVVFMVEVTLGTEPVAGELVSLFKAAQNIDGTDDEVAPDDDNQAGFLCSFPLDNVATAQRWESAPIPRSIVSDWKIYLHNGSAADQIDANWKVLATPVTVGPSA